jgi:adenylate cyclase
MRGAAPIALDPRQGLKLGFVRKLTTILAADVAGYSRMMGEDEAGALEILMAHRARVTKGVTEHGGRVVSWSGDGLIADFASCVEAVRAGIVIQNELVAANSALPQPRRMEFRIGINLGDVFVEDQDLLGEGVNIAARLQALCEPGGVYISGTVFDQVRTKVGGTEFVYLGERQVKNIVEPVPVYAVAFSGAPVTKPSRAVRGRGAAATDELRPAGIGRRALACAIDLIVAAFLVYLIFAPLELIFNDVVEVDTPFFNLAQERVIRHTESAIQHGDAGDIITVENIIERTILGLNKHYYRETERELKTPGGTSYTKVDGTVHREMVNEKTFEPIQRPKAMQFFLVVYIAYISFFEGRSRGAALGKRAMGIAVRDENGRPLTMGRAFGRNLAKIASALTIGFGFLMVLWTKQRQALHDQLADCRVVVADDEVRRSEPRRQTVTAAT